MVITGTSTEKLIDQVSTRKEEAEVLVNKMDKTNVKITTLINIKNGKINELTKEIEDLIVAKQNNKLLIASITETIKKIK